MDKKQTYETLEATYRQLVAKRADREKDLLIYAQNPEWYTEDLVAEIRADFQAATKELEAVRAQLREMEKDEELVALLMRKMSGTSPVDDLILVPYSEIEEKSIEWLWYPYIPMGRITILEGDPEQGKTWFSLSVATSVTLGGWWFSMPEEDSLMEPSRVLHMQCEDDPEDTVKRRLRILQTDQSKLILMQGRRQSGKETPLRVTMDDVARLALAIDRTQAKLVIIDPIQAYMPQGFDPNKAQEVRPLMMALQALAKQKHCAILLIRHLSKGSKDRPVYRGYGSIDWTAAARSVLLAVKYKDALTGRWQFCIAQSKNNLCAHGPSLLFEINQGEYSWVGTSTASSDELMIPALEQKSLHDVQSAIRFLLTILHDSELSWEQIVTQGRKSKLSAEVLALATKQARLRERIEDGMTYFSSPYRH